MEFHHGCTLVHLRVRKWGGEAKALDSDYKADGELPPANLLKRGQKAVFPPSALTAFDTLRRKAERVLLSKGTRFAGGFLVANEGLEDVLELLKQIEGEFDQAKTKFLSEFDMNLENWLAANAEHQRVIRQILDKDYIGAKFGFGYDLLEISPKPGHEFDEEAISSSVLHEVGVLCNTAADSLCDRKNDMAPASLISKLEPMMTKLNAMRFNNGRLTRLLDQFEELEKAIPVDGLIKKDDPMIGHVVSFLSMCGSERRLESILSGETSVKTMLQGAHGKLIAEVAEEDHIVITSRARGRSSF